MNKAFIFLLFIISIFCLSSNYLIKKSLQGEFALNNSFPNATATLAQVDSLLPFYPILGASAYPINLYRAKASLMYGDAEKGYKYILSAKRDNPYTSSSDYFLSMVHLQYGDIDSAMFYSKKAFFAWPKNIEHFKLYLELIAQRGDTMSILDAGKFVNSTVDNQSEFIRILKKQYNVAKLTYLITSFPDASYVNKDTLIGQWDRVYNFKNSPDVFDSSTNYTFNDNTVLIRSPNDTLEYNYDIKLDSIFFYFKGSSNSFSSNKLVYSDSLKTLIFKNVFTNDIYQDQYFKKRK